jgi:hypothetical protein
MQSIAMRYCFKCWFYRILLGKAGYKVSQMNVVVRVSEELAAQSIRDEII